MTNIQDELHRLFAGRAASVAKHMDYPATDWQCHELARLACKQDDAHIRALKASGVYLTYDRAESMLAEYADSANSGRRPSAVGMVS